LKWSSIRSQDTNDDTEIRSSRPCNRQLDVALGILPDICFTTVPYGLTLEGQYIVKNMALLSAGLALGGGVRREGRRQADRLPPGT
jgi:hypothetical protein